MSDVKAFIDTVGKDVTSVAAPRIDELAKGINDFVASLIQELCQRYRPEILGEVHARIAQGGLDLTGHGVKLDLKRQDTGAVVASLDIPIAIRINVSDLAVTLKDTTIKLDVVR